MDIEFSDLESLGSHAAHVRVRTGASHAEALRHVKMARDRYGIDPDRFIEERLYLIPIDELDQIDGNDRYVSLVANERGISYSHALALMTDVRERFGIRFNEFANQRLFRFKTEAGLRNAVRRSVEREGSYIRQVCIETGWSVEEAEARMRAAKDKWGLVDFRKFAAYGLAGLSDGEVESRIKEWLDFAAESRKKVRLETGWSRAQVREHMTRFQVVHGVIPAYYMCYRAWELTDSQVEGYATQQLSTALASRVNDPAATELMSRKDQFDALYAPYVRRKFWVNENTSFEDFLAFAEGLDEAFCKPVRSGGGLGTFMLSLGGGRDELRAIYDDLMSKPLVLAEERVRQHDEVSAFYPESVNTVRVVVFRDNEGSHIISTGIRFGSSGITDNFSGGGMVCDVDIETGRIVTPAVDKKGEVFDRHPSSRREFVGFQIPHWERVLKTARDAMDVLPGIRYVGWDIAISPESVSLIEGNSVPDLVLVQAPYAPMKVGKRYLFDPFLEKTAKKSASVSAPRVQQKSAEVTAVRPTPATPPVTRNPSGGRRDAVIRKARGAVRRIKRVVRRVLPEPKGHVILDSGFQVKVTGTTAAVVRFQGSETVVSIPPKIRGRAVTSVLSGAFEGVTGLTSVNVPEGVTSIGQRAFAGCSSLREVHLPATLIELGSFAFARCESLLSLELPESLEVVNKSSFEGATSLVEIGLPYALRRIGMDSFKGCTSLQKLYYYSQRGISDVMTTDRSLREDVLPTLVEYIGTGAFQDCTSLARVDIPYKVTHIPSRAFSGCVSLTHVGLHNRIREIGSQAFQECTSLESLRVPARCAKIGEDAFSANVELVTGRRFAAANYAKASGQKWRSPESTGNEISSRMIPGADAEPFFAPEQMAAAIERFEIRQPSFASIPERQEIDLGVIPESRFSFDGTVYHGRAADAGRARIMMVGDLMTRFRQQMAAQANAGSQFDFSFEHVRETLHLSDLAVGNLETMVSASAPYTLEQEHVNARPHLNSPESFLAALRRAGFDAVTNAQNHIYDAGTRGVFETLEAANRCQLMHTGAYVSPQDERFLVADIGGIKVGMVAYLDSARQMMKKANFTKTGLEVMFPYFDPKRIAADIASARAAGAEFVFAFCHWGREYTAEITARQRGFAQSVIDAGADYIVGAHSHCIQPYEILTAADGRRVPCLWSAGNFISDINLKPPITRDTLIMDVTLARSDSGRVVIDSETYHPCRILNLSDNASRNYAVVPTSTRLPGATLRKGLGEAHGRIVDVVGPLIAPAVGVKR